MARDKTTATRPLPGRPRAPGATAGLFASAEREREEMNGSHTARRHRLFWAIALMSVLVLLVAPPPAAPDPGTAKARAPPRHPLRKGELPQHAPASKPLQQ